VLLCLQGFAMVKNGSEETVLHLARKLNAATVREDYLRQTFAENEDVFARVKPSSMSLSGMRISSHFPPE
jgi:hypothetical protein